MGGLFQFCGRQQAVYSQHLSQHENNIVNLGAPVILVQFNNVFVHKSQTHHVYQ